MLVRRRAADVVGDKIVGGDAPETAITGVVSIGRRVVQWIPQLERLGFRRIQPEQGAADGNEKRDLIYQTHILGCYLNETDSQEGGNPSSCNHRRVLCRQGSRSRSHRLGFSGSCDWNFGQLPAGQIMASGWNLPQQRPAQRTAANRFIGRSAPSDRVHFSGPVHELVLGQG